MKNDEPLGLGLIGCGAFGLFCMEAFSEMKDVRVSAVADVRRDAAEAAAGKLRVPARFAASELIARDDVQIVHIATPPASHHELVLAAAGAGKHVLCEKPLAMNVAQADEMLAAAEEAGTIAPVNFVLRYNRVTDAVKAIIDSGVMGKVLSARLTNCASDTPLTADHWFWDRAVSGGIFIEHGVHFFDLYRHWLGPGAVIDAHTETREGTSQEDRVMCTVRHDNGAVASHYHGFDQFLIMDRTGHRLVCELGDIMVEGWIPLTAIIDAAVDDEGEAALRALCPDCRVETLAKVGGAPEGRISRGKPRSVSKRIRLTYRPNPDKQGVYAESVRALLADQVAHLRDRSRVRTVSEANGRDSLALAEAAARRAASE
jgi:predicted dehydrogenase